MMSPPFSKRWIVNLYNQMRSLYQQNGASPWNFTMFSVRANFFVCSRGRQPAEIISKLRGVYGGHSGTRTQYAWLQVKPQYPNCIWPIKSVMVEPAGVEPATFTLPAWRSPNWAKAPLPDSFRIQVLSRTCLPAVGSNFYWGWFKQLMKQSRFMFRAWPVSYGGACRTRTDHLKLAKLALSQMS